MWRLAGHGGSVWTVAFHPDGRRLASGGTEGDVRLWDVSTGKETACLQAKRRAIRALAFTPDGERLLTAGNDHLWRIWRLDSDEELVSLRDRPVAVWSLAVAPDGRTVAIGY